VRIKAGVARLPHMPLSVEDLDIDTHSIRATEVLVKLVATGLCHTDLAAREQHIPITFPAILGHEGAGIVEAVGEAVISVKVGDRVVLAPAHCGRCSSCLSGHPSYCLEIYALNLPGPRTDGSTPYTDSHGHAVNGGFFGQSSFATYCLASESSVVRIDDDSVPLEILGPLGCGLQTGAGTVLNVLRPAAGDSIAVFGTGPVGLAAVMAAKAAGCTTVIAIDVNDQRLALAKSLGATHTLNSRDQPVTDDIRQQIHPGGVHCSVDTTGRNDVIAQAVGCLMVRGRCALVAVPSVAKLELDWSVMTAGRSIEFVQEGDSLPRLFIPKLIDLYRRGLFPFDRLVSFYELADLNQAIKDFEIGTAVKPVIRMPH
jgi:aryl-alcohol dehydrogenase